MVFDGQSDSRVLADVSTPTQRVGSHGLLFPVDWRNNVFPGGGKADRDTVQVPVGGGETADPCSLSVPPLLFL